MPVTRLARIAARLRRLRAQDGFTMIVALGVLTVSSLLAAAAFVAVTGDTYLTRADLDGKRAYGAAQAAVQSYLYQLNANSSTSAWWENCTNDTLAKTVVPGSTTGVYYSYAPVLANGATTCSATDPVTSLIDTTTGTLRMKFTGYSGSASRTVVASFRTLSPLSFLWYTKYETVDSTIQSGCNVMYYTGGGPPSSCDIYWMPGDQMKGPMYTQDQFMVQTGANPIFGRGAQDMIASEEPVNSASAICANSGGCPSTVQMRGTAEPNVTPKVPLPSDNSNLATDATKHGVSRTGTITLNITGTTATGWNCTSATSCTTLNLNLVNTPIIYASSGVGCNTAYTPTSVSYSSNQITSGANAGAYYGTCGDVYVTGSYSTPLTIGADNDVIVTGGGIKNSTDANGTTSPTGAATLGLVANEYVRVKHDCSGNPAVTIDAAILTLQHSFFVDNYNCGGGTPGLLHVHGAIAQYFRGIVIASGAGGYTKDYNYDNRLGVILPPYVFDLQNTAWSASRETLCSTTVATTAANSCGV